MAENGAQKGAGITERGVVVTFCQLDISYSHLGKGNIQLRNRPYGRSVDMSMVFSSLLIHVGGPRLLWEVTALGRLTCAVH